MTDPLLQLAPGLRTRLDGAGHVVVEPSVGKVVDAGPHGFAILALLAEPATLGELITRLEERFAGSTELMPAMAALHGLIDADALVPTDGGGPTRGWADPVEHARMLDDDRRTGDYLAAIAATVRPGDVVIDIGTGSGVLAVAAARAGARRVYAIEATDIADVAERVFAANGVADRVTLVRGWSLEVDLPELADVLVTETIGSEPLEEDILSTVVDARRRLLRPGARQVPQELTLLARPLLVPGPAARQRSIGRAAVRDWQHRYGIDFEPLLAAANPGLVHEMAPGELAATWPTSGPAVPLATIDLAAIETATVHAAVDLVLDPPGAVNAVALTFRADLDGQRSHTLDPWTWPRSSWTTSVWLLPDAVTVGPDQVLHVRYHHQAAGWADGLTCELRPR